MKKSKKRRAIAPAGLGGCGGLDLLLESLPEHWEGLRTSGRALGGSIYN